MLYKCLTDCTFTLEYQHLSVFTAFILANDILIAPFLLWDCRTMRRIFLGRFQVLASFPRNIKTTAAAFTIHESQYMPLNSNVQRLVIHLFQPYLLLLSQLFRLQWCPNGLESIEVLYFPQPIFFKEIFNNTHRHLCPCGHMGGVVLSRDKCQHWKNYSIPIVLRDNTTPKGICTWNHRCYNI